MEPTWIFRRVNNNYIPFCPDNKTMADVLTKEEVEQQILYRGSLAELDLDKVPHTTAKVYIHDRMVKYLMTQVLSENLKRTMGYNKVVVCKLKIIYTADDTPNVLDYAIVLFQDEYRTRIESEIVKVMWNNTIKEIINAVREMFPSTAITEEYLHQVLGIELKENREGW
jgi:hypothetical protein